jgi:acylphosphatase
MTCRQIIVTGRVQGVFFRVSTRDIAVSFGLTGHAVNRPDGSVEVLACGDDSAVSQLERWLATGPRMASVTGVQCADVDCTAPPDFTVG